MAFQKIMIFLISKKKKQQTYFSISLKKFRTKNYGANTENPKPLSYFFIPGVTEIALTLF